LFEGGSGGKRCHCGGLDLNDVVCSLHKGGPSKTNAVAEARLKDAKNGKGGQKKEWKRLRFGGGGGNRS